MKKLYLYIALAVPFMAFMSCSNTNPTKKDNGVKTESNAVNEAASDSTSKVAQEKKEEPKKTYATTEAQLNYMKNSGNWAKYSTGILPDMASDAPAYLEKILASGKNNFIIVDKGKMHLFLYDKFGNIVKKYPIACAKNYGNKRGKGDSRTNEGYFPAQGVFDSRDWLFTNDAGYTSPAKGVYGPWFIRVIHPIGIHGTSSPGSIGKRVSHGCIRVTNDNITELIKYVEKDTPIIVSPGPKDMAVNAKEGRPTLAVVTEPGTPKCAPGKEVTAPLTASTSTKNSEKADNAEADTKSNVTKEKESKESKDSSAKTSEEDTKHSAPAEKAPASSASESE